MIKIYVNGQSVTAEYSPVASDSKSYLQASFSFSPDWYGLVKTAQFTQNGKTYNVLIDKNKCVLPDELCAGFVDISVFGVSASDSLRITTLPCTLAIKKSAFVGDGETPIPPTPDLYSQLIGKLESAVEKIPEKLSEFENDVGFMTDAQIPAKLSQLENDAGYITETAIPDLPTKVSQFENDAGYIAPTVANELNLTGATVNISGGSVTIGSTSYGFSVSGNSIKDVGEPTADTDGANKKYVDEKLSGFVAKNQGTANVGKILAVGSDGNLTFVDMPEGGVSGDVVGVLDEDNNILISGNLADGTYTLKYVIVDDTGAESYQEIGTLEVGEIPEAEPVKTNFFDVSTGFYGRIGSDGMDRTDSPNIFVTNYIAVQTGDVVVISGCDICSQFASGNNTYTAGYSASKAKVYIDDTYTGNDYWAVDSLTDTDAQFTVLSSGIAYLRFVCANPSGQSVIVDTSAIVINIKRNGEWL